MPPSGSSTRPAIRLATDFDSVSLQDSAVGDDQSYRASHPPSSTTNRRKSFSPLSSTSGSAGFGATTAASNSMEQGGVSDQYSSPLSETATFNFPSSGSANSRSRVGTSSSISPTARPRPRTSAGSSSGHEGHGFIGGAFARANASGKSVSSLAGALRRSQITKVRSSRWSRLVWIALGLVAVWLLLGRKREAPVRQKVRTRWWETGTPDELKQLLPKPSMPPKPPQLKPPALTSHSLAQLSRLPSTFSASASSDWTAIVHITSTSQISHLDTLLPFLQKQSLPPKRILVLAPQGLNPPIPRGALASLISYPSSTPPAVALIETAAESVSTDYLLLLDAALDSPLPSSYTKSLLRAAGTKEYSSALLSTGGIVLPTVPSSPSAHCLSTTTPSSSSSQPAEPRTSLIHIPTEPSLLQTTWLSLLANGLRTDLPLEAGIALALWSKAGIPAFALPVPASSSNSKGGVERDWGCERIRRSLSRQERSVGALFRRELGGGGGLRARRNAPKLTEEEVTAGVREEGPIVFLLAGKEEVELVHPLACGLASTNDVRVYVADADGGPRAFFLSQEADAAGQRCHLDLHRLGSGSEEDRIASVLADELERIGPPAVVFYLQDGRRGNEFSEVMRWTRAIFGRRDGGKRRSRAQMDEEDAAVVIALRKEDVVYADWLAALPLQALRHWHTPRIDLTVITQDRPDSLQRLLASLRDAHYFGDDVSLSVNLEQTADQKTQQIAEDIEWSQGTLTVRHRIVHGGLLPAIVESWYPSTNDSYGVFLEDDTEVSPFFYGWLKYTILQYRYGDPALRPASARLFGVSLYQPRNLELLPDKRRPFDAHKLFASLSLSPTIPYLSQVPCSWGAVYFPEVWREFHSYLALRLSEIALPISEHIVPDIKSNRWPRSWKKYFIELVYLRGYVMLYPNYADFASFSTNHVEMGTHIKHNLDLLRRRALFEVPLMARNQSLLDLPSGRLPQWTEMPLLDFWGSIATDEEVIERGWQTWSQLDTCKTPLRLDQPLTFNARELLCKKVYDVERLVDAQPLQPLIKSPPIPPPLVDHPDSLPLRDALVDVVPADHRHAEARDEEAARIMRELQARRAALVNLGARGPEDARAGEGDEPRLVEMGEEPDILLHEGEETEDAEDTARQGREATEDQEDQGEWLPLAENEDVEEDLLADDEEERRRKL